MVFRPAGALRRHRHRRRRFWRRKPAAPILLISARPSSPPKKPTPSNAYKQALVEGSAADIVYSNLFTGVHRNYLRASIDAAGLDPDNLPEGDVSTMNFHEGATKAWKDIWGAGQGIGAVKSVVPAAISWPGCGGEYAKARKEVGRFLKKAPQKLSLNWACGGEAARPRINKVFLLLFVHKK